MNLDDLEEMLAEVLPAGFSIETDNHGQLIVYTGLRVDDDGEIDQGPCSELAGLLARLGEVYQQSHVDLESVADQGSSRRRHAVTWHRTFP